MATIFKRPTSPFWFACYSDRTGKTARRSTKSTDRAAANRMALEWERVERAAKEGQASVGGNVPTAASDWFVDAAHENLALNGTNLTAVDAGVPLPDVSEDASRRPRTEGKAPDAGAFEYRGRR